MKKIISFLFAAVLLALSQPIFAQDRWRPIAEITNFEKGIIQQATRQSPDWIYKDAAGFSVKHEVVITILLKDGTVKYYAAGEDKNVDAVNDIRTPKIENYTTPGPKEMALDIANKFLNIWGGKRGSDLSIEELQKADELMYAFFNILQTNPEIISDVLMFSLVKPLMIGNRGNRYLSAFMQLPVDAKHKLEFYDSYISSMYSLNSTAIDRPEDSDQIAAIQEIKKILSAMDKTSTFSFGDSTRDEIKRLDPDFYKSITLSETE